MENLKNNPPHFLNFKAENENFKNLVLENLGLFNFIVGENGVGKSWLLNEIVRQNISAYNVDIALRSGKGADKAYSIISKMKGSGTQILTIDDIEYGLHHSIMKDFLEILLGNAYKWNKQIFATTHNLEFLEKLLQVLWQYPEWQEHTKIIKMAHTPKFGIKGYVYKYSEFEHAMENGNELR